MSLPDFSRVAEVVASAHELAGRDRASYLDEACAGDAALRAEVESLLAYDADQPGLLATDAVARALTDGFLAGPDGAETSDLPDAVGAPIASSACSARAAWARCIARSRQCHYSARWR